MEARSHTKRGMRALVGAVLIAAIGVLAGAGVAAAATVELAPSRLGTGQQLVYFARSGEANRLTVLSGFDAFAWVSEAGAPLSAFTACALVGAGPPGLPPGTIARCDAADLSGAIVELGDGDDVAATVVPLPVELVGGTGSDRLAAGSADDAVFGDAGADQLDGGGGDDLLEPGAAADVVAGGDGSDTVDYYDRAAPLAVDLEGDADDGEAGEGDQVGADVENVIGGRADDALRGSAEANALEGEAGADGLLGGAGDDLLLGAGGRDDIHGEDGDDQLDGGADADALDGGPGDDALAGAGGRDTLAGGDDADVLAGEGGDDQLSGGGSGDTLAGDAGDDTLAGDAGVDVMYGGAGADSLAGGDGADVLDGGSGADSLAGGEGADVLRSVDPAADRIECGGGVDRVEADTSDLVGADCEVVTRIAPIPRPDDPPPAPVPPRDEASAPTVSQSAPSEAAAAGPEAFPVDPVPAPAAPAAVPLAAAPARDRVAPAVSVRAGVRAPGRVTVALRCSEPCSVTADLLLSARQARSLGLRSRRLARGRAQGAGAARLLLRVARRARGLRVTLSVRVVDAAGNRRALLRSVRL